MRALPQEVRLVLAKYWVWGLRAGLFLGPSFPWVNKAPAVCGPGGREGSTLMFLLGLFLASWVLYFAGSESNKVAGCMADVALCTVSEMHSVERRGDSLSSGLQLQGKHSLRAFL